KALAAVLDQASITDTDGKTIDLDELVPQDDQDALAQALAGVEGDTAEEDPAEDSPADESPADEAPADESPVDEPEAAKA
ncbi:MAG: trigger factor, partial [Ornithinibacter sp.]